MERYLWTSGYYANTVGQYGNKDVIRKYIENQGKEVEYKKIHGEQLKLWIYQYLGVVYCLCDKGFTFILVMLGYLFFV